jgi:hypothetical protein
LFDLFHVSKLKGILSYIDANANLDLLFSGKNSENSWIVRFWMHMFSDENLMNLTYKRTFLQPNNNNNNEERREFLCASSLKSTSKKFRSESGGEETKKLPLKLPFSWLIKQNLDELIQLKIRENTKSAVDLSDVSMNNNDHMIEQLLNVFSQWPLYERLEQFFSKEVNSPASAVIRLLFGQLYLNDFLLYNFTFFNEQHLNMVKGRFNHFCHTSFNHVGKHSLSFLVGIHLAYDVELKRETLQLEKFLQIDTSRILSRLVEKSEPNGSLSHLAARTLIDSFNENVSVDLRDHDWKNWFNNVQNSSQVIEAYMQTSYRETCQEMSSLWQRCTLAKLFIQHFCSMNVELYKHCIRLWNFFNTEPTDFKTLRSFKQLETVLSPVCKLYKGGLARFKEKCPGCAYENFEFLYKSCKNNCHVCEECIREVKSHKKCPSCREKIDNFSQFAQIDSVGRKKPNEFKKKLDQFRSVMNCFLMDLITNCTFNKQIDQALPEKEVIDYLIELLMPRGAVKPLPTASQGQNGSSTTLFDLNLNPSIKSTLFQLILSYDQANIEQHLSSIFSKSKSFLVANYDSTDLVDLKLMYMNSIEDSFYSKSTRDTSNLNLSLDIELACQFLESDLRHLSAHGAHARSPATSVTIIYRSHCPRDQDAADIIEFKLVAKIKFCICVLAKLLVEFDRANTLHLKFLEMSKRLIERNVDNCIWLRFFLIKNIFRRYGKSESVKSSNDSLFSWIIPKQFLSDVTFI